MTSGRTILPLEFSFGCYSLWFLGHRNAAFAHCFHASVIDGILHLDSVFSIFLLLSVALAEKSGDVTPAPLLFFSSSGLFFSIDFSVTISQPSTTLIHPPFLPLSKRKSKGFTSVGSFFFSSTSSFAEATKNQKPTCGFFLPILELLFLSLPSIEAPPYTEFSWLRGYFAVWFLAWSVSDLPTVPTVLLFFGKSGI